jgi:chemotaxis protein methyltransferase CheR
LKAEIDRTEVDGFRRLIARRLGILFDDAKLDYLADVLRSRIEARGDGQEGSYLGSLSGGSDSGEEWRILTETLTVAETYFFRYRDHFRAFVDVVLPEYTDGSGRLRQLRILSAGCASGEDPYSLAILLRERGYSADEGRKVSVVGIDVNPAVIQRATRARYSPWSLRDTPPDLRSRYFRPEGREFVLNEEIRSFASFEVRNLIEPDDSFWRPRSFDVVFCRNVTMYFAPEVTREVMARLRRSLAPGGYLFLGHAETLRGVADGFGLKHTHGTFYYKLRGHGESLAPAGPPAVQSPGDSSSVRTAGLLESSGSWFELIQRASDRIADLAKSSGSAVRAEEAPALREAPRRTEAGARPAWDLSMAIELLRQEKFGDALSLLSALPPDSSEDPDARLLRAVILTNGGDLSRAKNACRQILRADEIHAGAHYLMALCLEHEGAPEAAMEHDQTAAYLDPAFAMPRFHLGLLARRRGAVEIARRELEQALTLLAREDSARILLFGGGFSRDALIDLCRGELRSFGGAR